MKLTKVFIIAVIIKILLSSIVVVGTWCLAVESNFSKKFALADKPAYMNSESIDKCAVMSDISRIKATLKYISQQEYLASYDKDLLIEDIKLLENYLNTQNEK